MTLLDAITTDPLVAVLAALGPLGLALYGAIRIGPEVVRTIRHALRARQQRAITEADAKASAERWMRERVEALETRVTATEADCAKKLDAAEQRCEERTEERIAPMREALSALTDLYRRAWGEETTAVRHLDAIMARVSTPIPARPETIVPPPSGEEG